ncbi:leukotriene B4 receptor 1-like isoform X2 [Stigmatopora argus]
MAPGNGNGNGSLPLGSESIVDSTAATATGALILAVVFLLGFPGNLFVIWSILARARKQSVTTLLILNLAVADGSLMALTPFFVAYLVMKRWAFGTAMCKVLFYLCLANMYASIHIIAVMSLYRLLAVLRPRGAAAAAPGRRAVTWALAGVWALVAAASVPAAVFREVRVSDRRAVCDSFHDEDAHTIIQYTLELVFGFLIPYSVVVVSYVCILRRIRQTKFQRRVRSEKLILAIVVTFCVLWLPYHAVNVAHVSGGGWRGRSALRVPPKQRWPKSGGGVAPSRLRWPSSAAAPTPCCTSSPASPTSGERGWPSWRGFSRRPAWTWSPGGVVRTARTAATRKKKRTASR